jgi:hypothetical protein
MLFNTSAARSADHACSVAVNRQKNNTIAAPTIPIDLEGRCLIKSRILSKAAFADGPRARGAAGLFFRRRALFRRIDQGFPIEQMLTMLQYHWHEAGNPLKLA